jgi:hypothetical protein
VIRSLKTGADSLHNDLPFHLAERTEDIEQESA